MTEIKVAEGAKVVLPADMNIDTFRARLSGEVQKVFPTPKDNNDTWQYVETATLSYVILSRTEQGEKTLYKFNYTYNKDTDTFAVTAPEKVETTYVAAESVPMKLRVSETLEGSLSATQLTKGGLKWDVEIVTEGLSLSANASLASYGYPNKRAKRFYTAEAIEQGINDKLFDLAPCIFRSESDHLSYANGGGSKLNVNDEARQMTGVFSNVRKGVTAEGKVTAKGELVLRNNHIGRAMRDFLKERAAENFIPYELSWTGEVDCVLENPTSTEPTLKVTRIVQVDSIDPVLKGNAGGKIFRAAESYLTNHKAKTMDKELIKGRALIQLRAAEADVEGAGETGEGGALPDTLLQYAAMEIFKKLPDVYDSVDEVTALDEAKIVKLFAKNCNKKEAPVAEAKPKTEPVAESAAIGDLKKQMEQMQITASQNSLRAKLAESKLPEPFKELITKTFEGKAVSEAEMDSSIRTYQEASTKMASTQGNPAGIKVTLDGVDKLKRNVTNFFFQNGDPNLGKVAEAKLGLGYDPSHRDNKGFTSIRELFRAVMGRDIINAEEGFMDRKGRVSEAFDADIIAQIATDALNVRVAAEFFNEDMHSAYKKIAAVKSVSDFRSIHVQKYGGFATSQAFEISTSGADYQEMALTGDEDVTLSMKERGGLFSINWRDIVNDNTDFIQQLPKKRAQMWKQHLNKSITDLLWNAFSTAYTPTTYNVISTDHVNTSASPATITAARVIGAYKAMLQIAALGSAEPMGVPLKYIIHMVKDWDVVYPIITPAAGNSNLVATADQSIGLQSIVVPQFDAKGTFNRWFAMADPNVLESIAIYYLNGQTEPQIFQEVSNSGSAFTAKKLRFRDEFHWNAAVTDYRGIYGEKIS